jgi:hypothetical protein
MSIDYYLSEQYALESFADAIEAAFRCASYSDRSLEAAAAYEKWGRLLDANYSLNMGLAWQRAADDWMMQACTWVPMLSSEVRA